MQRSRISHTLLLLAVCFTISGCGSKQPADPKPMAESLGKLQDMAGEIIEAFKAGTPNQAHDQLHVVGDILGALPQQAMRAGLAATDISKIKESIESLFDGFGKLDKTLHSDEDVDLDVDAISEQINESIDAIIAKLPEGVMEKFGHAGHDHVEAGHDEAGHDDAGHNEAGHDDAGHEEHDGQDHDAHDEEHAESAEAN